MAGAELSRKVHLSAIFLESIIISGRTISFQDEQPTLLSCNRRSTALPLVLFALERHDKIKRIPVLKILWKKLLGAHFYCVDVSCSFRKSTDTSLLRRTRSQCAKPRSPQYGCHWGLFSAPSVSTFWFCTPLSRCPLAYSFREFLMGFVHTCCNGLCMSPDDMA
jgi:hypothetical protein